MQRGDFVDTYRVDLRQRMTHSGSVLGHPQHDSPVGGGQFARPAGGRSGTGNQAYGEAKAGAVNPEDEQLGPVRTTEFP